MLFSICSKTCMYAYVCVNVSVYMIMYVFVHAILYLQQDLYVCTCMCASTKKKLGSLKLNHTSLWITVPSFSGAGLSKESSIAHTHQYMHSSTCVLYIYEAFPGAGLKQRKFYFCTHINIIHSRGFPWRGPEARQAPRRLWPDSDSSHVWCVRPAYVCVNVWVYVCMYCDLQNNCKFDRPLKNAWMRGIPIQGPFLIQLRSRN